MAIAPATTPTPSKSSPASYERLTNGNSTSPRCSLPWLGAANPIVPDGLQGPSP